MRSGRHVDDDDALRLKRSSTSGPTDDATWAVRPPVSRKSWAIAVAPFPPDQTTEIKVLRSNSYGESTGPTTHHSLQPGRSTPTLKRTGTPAKVTPRASSPTKPHTPTRRKSVPKSRFTRLLHAWETVQVSHQGAYSVERLYAYREYSRNASVRRVVAACLLAPLPPLMFILILEAIPMNSPTLGWQANYMLFVRSFATSSSFGASLILQAKNILPDLRMTSKEIYLQIFAIGLCAALALLLLSILWTFPVPFTIAINAVPFTITTIVVVVSTIGIPRFRGIRHFRRRLSAFVKLIIIQGSMSLFYGSFLELYRKIEYPPTQIGAVFLLQIIKLVLKNLLVFYIAEGIDDFKPEIIVFSVKVYHSLYVAACIHATTSHWTRFVIVVLDVVSQALSLMGIYFRIQAVRKQLEVFRRSVKRYDVVAIVVDLLQNPDKLDADGLSSVRVNSILDHRLSRRGSNAIQQLRLFHLDIDNDPAPRVKAVPTSILPIPLARPEFERKSALLRSLEASINETTRRSARSARSVRSNRSSRSNGRSTGRGRDRSSLSIRERTQLVELTLGLLFSSEYVALAQYVMCVIPLVYAVYLPVMRTLPNLQYYPHLESTSGSVDQQAEVAIAAYSALQALAFTVFHSMLSRTLGVSPLYQLAFVLENQIEMIEGKLFAWTLIALQFPLPHFGADFSFKFRWVQ